MKKSLLTAVLVTAAVLTGCGSIDDGGRNDLGGQGAAYDEMKATTENAYAAPDQQ